MIKQISWEEIESYPEAGYFGEYGAVIGTATEVIIEGRAGVFLVSVDNFELSEMGGFPVIRPKAKLILAIGGLPETEAESLARELEISVNCAQDVIYLRTRSRWSSELEIELIKCHESGVLVDISSFGVTKETQARMHWNIQKNLRDKKSSSTISRA